MARAWRALCACVAASLMQASWAVSPCADKINRRDYDACMGYTCVSQWWDTISYCPDYLDHSAYWSREDWTKKGWCVERRIVQHWLSDGGQMSKEYHPKITVECAQDEKGLSLDSITNWLPRKRYITLAVKDNGREHFLDFFLNLGAKYEDLKHEYGIELDMGPLQYYIPNMDPVHWKVEVLSKVKRSDSTLSAIFTKPDTWYNFRRCDGQTPDDPYQRAWNAKNPQPFCPTSLKATVCRIHVDFYSTPEDEACLNKQHSRWGRDGDTQCTKQGQAVNSVGAPAYCPRFSDRNDGYVYTDRSPPFCARRMTYDTLVSAYLPTKVDIAVKNGKWANPVRTYEQYDATAFKGVRRAIEAVGSASDCPSGTWLTCVKPPASEILDAGVCTYAVAFVNVNASTWAKDLRTFYVESDVVNNTITQVVSLINPNGNNIFERMVPGVNGTTCFPCATAGGKTHYGEILPGATTKQFTDGVIPFYCPGTFQPPQACPLQKVVPYHPTTGLSRSATCVCDHGWYSSEDGCVICPAGSRCNVTDAYDPVTWVARTPDPRPIPCENGTWSAAGASTCLTCDKDVSACTQRQQMSACVPVPGATREQRTKYQQEPARCVSCKDCEGIGKSGGRPCLGAKQSLTY